MCDRMERRRGSAWAGVFWGAGALWVVFALVVALRLFGVIDLPLGWALAILAVPSLVALVVVMGLFIWPRLTPPARSEAGGAPEAPTPPEAPARGR